MILGLVWYSFMFHPLLRGQECGATTCSKFWPMISTRPLHHDTGTTVFQQNSKIVCNRIYPGPSMFRPKSRLYMTSRRVEKSTWDSRTNYRTCNFSAISKRGTKNRDIRREREIHCHFTTLAFSVSFLLHPTVRLRSRGDDWTTAFLGPISRDAKAK